MTTVCRLDTCQRTIGGMLVLTELLADVPTTTADALELFDSLPAVELEFMFGTWHGA